MEIVKKKKMFYTSFAALILSGITLQTAQADEAELKIEETSVNLVTEETGTPVIVESRSSEAAEDVAPATLTSQASSAPLLSATATEVKASEVNVQSEAATQPQASLAPATPTSETSLSYSQSTLIKQIPLASSEVQASDTSTNSEQDKPDIILTIDRTRPVATNAAMLEVSVVEKKVETLYTSELSGVTPNSTESSEGLSIDSLSIEPSPFATSEDLAVSELISTASSEAISATLTEAIQSESVPSPEEGSTVLTVGWPDSTSTSDIFETSEVVSLLQSDSIAYASEVMAEAGETAIITAMPISADVYTIVPKRDSTGAKVETTEVVEGNKDIIYVARGEVLNVNFDVNKMNGTKIKGLNLVLDGKKIHHSLFIEGTLDDINAGLSAYHLAEQTTGIHQMGFELIDTDNNIHYLTQTFSVFNDGETPVTPSTPSSYQPTVYPTSETTAVTVNYNYDAATYAEVATRIQATAVSELAETTRSLTQQLASQIAEALSDLSHAVSGHTATGTTPIDIFQAATHGVTQAAKKIAETISDPEVVGKQALAAATVALVLLVLYLAAITFI